MRRTLQVVLDDGDHHHHDLIKGSAVVGPPNDTVELAGEESLQLKRPSHTHARGLFPYKLLINSKYGDYGRLITQ